MKIKQLFIFMVGGGVSVLMLYMIGSFYHYLINNYYCMDNVCRENMIALNLFSYGRNKLDSARVDRVTFVVSEVSVSLVVMFSR